jgi:hypothetical protein
MPSSALKFVCMACLVLFVIGPATSLIIYLARRVLAKRKA